MYRQLAPAEKTQLKSAQASPEADLMEPGEEHGRTSRSQRAYGADDFDKDNPEIPVSRIQTLTAADRCSEAMSWMYIYLARNPDEAKTGRAWMQLAECYQRKGNEQEAKDAAGKALKIPASKANAESFLEELPSSEK